jgi:FKBP-type peptidyl-prolyl cis-trans isomerase SlyD
MIISDNSVVSIDYILRSDSGEVIDSSAEGEPLVYLHGHEQIVPGLEAALVGKKKGDALKVTVAPEHGYGDHDPGGVIRVPASAMPIPTPEVGMEFIIRSENGHEAPVRVVGVDAEHVTIDGNHPLAGKDLHFEVKVVDVRTATAEELAHEHVHGPGGHH